jgi:hypothetical protein
MIFVATEGKPTTVRCGIYARSALMVPNEGNVRNQIAECRRIAQEKGWLVVDDCIRFDAGRSGTSVAGRPGLRELLALAESEPRPFEVLLCESVSRLSRTLSDILAIDDTLRRNRIQLSFVDDELRSSIFEAEPAHAWLGRWIPPSTRRLYRLVRWTRCDVNLIWAKAARFLCRRNDAQDLCRVPSDEDGR